MDVSVVVPGPVDVARTRFQFRGEDPANRLSDGVFRRAIKRDGRSKNEVNERSMAVREFGRRRVFEMARAAASGGA
jgi:hypothetical protein